MKCMNDDGMNKCKKSFCVFPFFWLWLKNKHTNRKLHENRNYSLKMRTCIYIYYTHTCTYIFSHICTDVLWHIFMTSHIHQHNLVSGGKLAIFGQCVNINSN